MTADAPLNDLPESLLAAGERQLRELRHAAEATQAQLAASHATIADTRAMTAANDAAAPPAKPDTDAPQLPPAKSTE